jgi:hypothetical protein
LISLFEHFLFRNRLIKNLSHSATVHATTFKHILNAINIQKNVKINKRFINLKISRFWRILINAFVLLWRYLQIWSFPFHLKSFLNNHKSLSKNDLTFAWTKINSTSIQNKHFYLNNWKPSRTNHLTNFLFEFFFFLGVVGILPSENRSLVTMGDFINLSLMNH